MNHPKYNLATFLMSAAELDQLPAEQGIEVAFAGRSNAGKSSALNALTNNKKLAKTSKTPGRTQLINVFVLDDQRRLIDLPGYGYAKVSQEVKQRWQHTLAEYLELRQSLKGLILVMDIRHPLKELDQHLLAWASQANLAVHILLTKADKLNYGPAKSILIKVTQALSSYNNPISVQLFSAVSKDGLETLQSKLNTWYEVDKF